MAKLSDPDIRRESGLNAKDQYMFPQTKNFSKHSSGWHAGYKICTDAAISDPELKLLTATKMRHLVSTIFAKKDVSEQDRSLFYTHMGHSQGINTSIY
jgi:hypothetical protein